MATLLKHLDDLVLVLGEDLSETIGTLDEIMLCSTRETTVDEPGRVVDLCSESKHLASFLSDSNSVTSQHLDGNTELLGLDDGLSSILTGRVEHGEETKEDPVTVVLLVGNTERTETTPSEIGSPFTEETSGLFIAVGQLENGVGGTLGADVLVTAHVADGSNTLGDGVERSELFGPPALVEDFTSLGVATDGEEGNLVDRVQGLEIVGRSQSSDGHHPVDILALSDVGLTDTKLVGSKGTGLVRAENVDTSKRLDGGELLDDSLLLGQVGGTDSQGSSGDDGKTDGHTDDEQDQSVVEKGDGAVPAGAGLGDAKVTEETTDPCSEDEEHDQDEKRSTDGVHDGLEMSLVLSSLDKTGGATDERVPCGDQCDTVGFAAFATGGVVGHLAHVLVDGKRLSGDGGLIGGNEGVTLGNGAFLIEVILVLFVIRVGSIVKEIVLLHLQVLLEILGMVVVADKTNIGGNGGTFFDDDNVTGNDLTCQDLDLATVTNDGGLHGNVTLETGHDIGSLLLLVPTDDSVEHKNTADDTEIDPVAKTGGQQGGDFHNIENGTLEIAEELLDPVRLLRGQLIPAETPATVLDLMTGDTLADIGFEHLRRHWVSGLTNGERAGVGWLEVMLVLCGVARFAGRKRLGPRAANGTSWEWANLHCRAQCPHRGRAGPWEKSRSARTSTMASSSSRLRRWQPPRRTDSWDPGRTG